MSSRGGGRGCRFPRAGATLASMHPTGVANAAWVFAAAPSKVPFYVAGGLLAGWAVLLAAMGLTHPEFPGSEGRTRLVMLSTVVLVAATITAAVATSGEEGEEGETARAPARGAATPSSVLRLSADPTGQLAYDRKRAELKAGRVTIRFVNRSPVAHDVTVAKGSKKVAATKVIDHAETTATANLPPGEYVFFCSVDAHRPGGMQGTLTVR
jgi:plastocyanin